MGEKKLPEFITFKEFQENIRNWSKDTFLKNVEENGFPAFKENGSHWVINVPEARIWFKRREGNK